MKTLLVVMMLVSCSVFADGYRIYERYGYWHWLGGRVRRKVMSMRVA